MQIGGGNRPARVRRKVCGAPLDNLLLKVGWQGQREKQPFLV
ncbi:hypothetical protein BN128_1118 [Cronobacter sakazakii 696]|nr:hypothetical protein BN129_1063 [Cronobacter sakazakii 701]CCK05461.1 hypothetical protein BN128_1118 [Cronobacter sakazakii 696]